MTNTRPGVTAVTALALLLAGSAGLRAQSVTLDFAPPDMVVTPICVARVPDSELLAEWGAWDGKALPDRDIGLINRDLRRLAEIDPVAWDPTIQRIIELLPDFSPSFTEDNVLLAQINQMIELGQLQELRATGLVQQLLDRGEENSPRMLGALSEFLTEGIGIDRNRALGTELLMSAGYGGNADALLTLSHLAVAGNAPDGWDVHPELAVTMAFGSLVGQIDPLICDRIARIAREFSNGGVVSVDHDMAVRWYRFAADLGDPISAWRVAEYELQSELVTKDNDLLLTYLKKASDGQLPYAQVALGRVYEAGALLGVDLERAQNLYEAAADAGDRAGLIRLSGFLEAQLPRRPTLKSTFMDTLVRLENLENPPPWVFAKRAALILDEQGRWSGQAEARPLLERGAAMGDPAATFMLARLDMADARTDGEFYEVVDILIQAVIAEGDAAPTANLQAAFVCKAPGAPLLDQASYWAKAEAAIGSLSFEFTDVALKEMAENPDPLEMAALQTQALYGRATPLANLLAVLERDGSPASEIAFWTALAEQSAPVATARAELALADAATPAAREAALDQFRAAFALGDKGAALKLSKALLTDPVEAAMTEAAALLVTLARQGNGEAMALLPDADPATYPNPRAVFEAFSGQIDTRGDFMALMLAMPFLPDAATREVYHKRAIAVMSCTFSEALAFAHVMRKADDRDAARGWLAIAEHLAADVGWQIVKLGDGYRTLSDDDSDAQALALYEKAFELGDRTSVYRLLRVHGDPKQPAYDQDRIVSLYGDLVARSTANEIPAVLNQIAAKDAPLRRAIEAQLDIDQLYADAAAAGNPAAMREHARRLRGSAVSRAEIETSTDWLVKASDNGDVPAMVMLAQSYAMGVGVPASNEKARDWLIKAAEAGDPAAIDMVKLFTFDTGTN